jgi:hypothetical protein
MRRLPVVTLALATLIALSPTPASAQDGAIAGIVRDSSNAVLPGVLVEVASSALIEKVRSTTTDGNGQYRITALPIGTYTVTFQLATFNTVRREDVALSTGFTATVDVTLAIGNLTETIVVQGSAPTIDVQSARQVTVFRGEDLRDLPTSRNVSSIMNLVPGFMMQTGVFNADAGVCVGGVGTWCSPNVYSFNAHSSALDADGLRQGRLLVDGMVVNTASNPITGSGGGYIADVTNVQEVSFNLSGALGESETGGASINIVPRTGGNRFAGNYSTTYTRQKWFATNNDTHTSVTINNLVQYNYDVTGTFGGPIKRDHLWFYSSARSQGKEQIPGGGRIYYNKNAGLWGANYEPDRTREPLTYENLWRNAYARITWQASQKSKFNFYWDEQDTCQDPCNGSVAAYTSPESFWSVWTYPNRIGQVRWTNPQTNKLLFEGGINIIMQQYNFTKHRYVDNPQSIPRVNESGVTAGGDAVATRVNQTAGNAGAALTSGSLYSGNQDNYDNWRASLSAAYVSGSHNAKIGFEGQYYWQTQRAVVNEPRLQYTYTTPGATCYNVDSPSASTCGNTSLYYPGDPFNQTRRPVPSMVEINVGDRAYDERVWTNSMFVQDQWTLNRFTLSGALRYDMARSSYGETCVGPDIFVITPYCTPAVDGVSYHDITPRGSASWNVFGDGKTAIKFNTGKYLAQAGFQDVYSGANPARRTQNTLSRGWEDLDGDRIADCDFRNNLEHTNLGDRCLAVANLQTFRRFGTDPYLLDETGDAIGLATTHCGRTETGIPQAVRDYCARSGQNLLSGWGTRRSEWQLGLGVQRELLPQLSAEVTYNQRWYQNQLLNDTIGVGCDLFSSTTQACNDAVNNRVPNAQYSFYSVRAPVDPRLPNGGGYLIQHLDDRNTQAALTGPVAIVAVPYTYGWRGIDTNFVYRMRGGLRLNGGTSTGKSFRDLCDFEINGPNQRQREGGPAPACAPPRPWQTNIRGSATYTIPWVDVLASVVFQSRPGVERSANLNYTFEQVMWEPGSEARATNTVGCATTGANTAPVGCLFDVANNNAFAINLLDFSDLWGERITYFDLKLGKNLRFAGKRLNIGVDIFNLFNSDAIDNYNNTYTAFRQADGSYVTDNPATAAVEVNNWGNPTSLMSPRFVQLSLQFEF